MPRLTVKLNDQIIQPQSEEASLRRLPFKLTQISSMMVQAMRILEQQSSLLALEVIEQRKALDRERRHAAIMSMHGIWKDDPTKPRDGAEYQREVRAEWS